MDGDLDLSVEYYRLRGRVIYLEHCAAALRLDPALLEMADLTRGVVHDLGNGLNVLRARMYPAPRRRGIFPAEARRVMETAGKLCECMGLRVYALPELSPDLPIRPLPVNLPDWLPEVLASFRTWLGGEESPARVEFHAGGERLITADYDRKLRLAVWEVLRNSADAHASVISVYMEKTSDGQALIRIQDDGDGLPDLPVEKLFMPGVTIQGKPAGIGLYVSRKIIEKHRGTLWLESVPGGGALASIRLPAGNPEPDWEDDDALSLAMEALSDRARALQAELGKLEAELAANGERTPPDLSQDDVLAAGFGRWSATTAAYLERGLGEIRTLMLPLKDASDRDVADMAAFALNKIKYLETVTANFHILGPGGAAGTESIDLNVLVGETARMLDWRARPGNVLVELHPARGLPLVHANRRWLAAALLNLLRNAIDAAGKGQAAAAERVTIETGSESGRVYTQICDNGPGATPEVQPRLFDFDYTSRSDRRYGLGLYIARRALESMGGGVEISSRPPIGTTVTLYL